MALRHFVHLGHRVLRWELAGCQQGQDGLFVALGGAVLTGGALDWANWLLGVGASL